MLFTANVLLTYLVSRWVFSGGSLSFLFLDSLQFKEQLASEGTESRLNDTSQIQQFLAVIQLILNLLVGQICIFFYVKINQSKCLITEKKTNEKIDEPE